MPKRVRSTVNFRPAEQALVRGTIDALTDAGRGAKSIAQGITPVLTGFAKRSIYFVVVDDKGRVVAGDSTDGNGNPVPRSFPTYGRYRAIVGANAPYFIWIEIGARGRPGRHIFAQAARELESRMRSALGRVKLK